MTVLDTSAVLDLLLGTGVAPQAEALLQREAEFAAPDLVVFETLAVLRRNVARGLLTRQRAADAVSDFADLQVELFPTLNLRQRAWALRENLRLADAIFLALAERLDEPLATKDERLAVEAGKHSDAEVILLRR